MDLVEISLKKQAKKIYNELYELYVAKIEVNQNFNDLVYEHVPKKYGNYKLKILMYVVQEIPVHLHIACDDRFVFYDNEEHYKLTAKLKNEKKKTGRAI